MAIKRASLRRESPMISTFAFEIGAMFLLAALLMYGTMSGFVPRRLKSNAAFPGLAIVGLLGFAIYRFGPEFDFKWRVSDTVAPHFTTLPVPMPGSIPAAVPAAPVGTVRAASKSPKTGHARIAKQPETGASKQPKDNWTTANDAIPAPEPLPPLVEAPAAKPVSEVPEHAETALVLQPSRVAEDDDLDRSPFDSGLKRAAKRVGRFLHIVRKKKDLEK